MTTAPDPVQKPAPGMLVDAMWAGSNADLGLIKSLLQQGADINETDMFGDTALTLAVQYGCVEIAKVLINAKADLDIQNDSGNTALITSLKFGRNKGEIASLLIENGAKLDIQNKEGNTALHIAAKWSYVEIIRQLLDKNAGLDIKNNDGDLAINFAERSGCTQTFDMLKEAAVMRKRPAPEFARAAKYQKRADTAAKLQKLRDAVKAKPKPVLKQPSAA